MRMPIGVPVVRPSKTPERMRTWSASRRWLTKCDVPVRRRSTSCCRSASVSSSPGGQPSTMHPSAGPWLSPKVVTVKSLPMVLPDMALVCQQLLARQQEHSAAAARELEPQERQSRVGAPHRSLGVADLDDEEALGTQVAARLAQDDGHRVEAARAGGERETRLVPVLRRQSFELTDPYVRWIGDDDIVGGAAERAEVVGALHEHAPPEAMAAHVEARDFERRGRDVHGVDTGLR